jgi:hypothetical protein
LTKELIPAFIESLWFIQFTQSQRKLLGIPAYKKDKKDNKQLQTMDKTQRKKKANSSSELQPPTTD